MTGIDLSKALKAAKGKVYAFTSSRHDGVFVAIQKNDLLAWCSGIKHGETGFKLIPSDNGWLLIAE